MAKLATEYGCPAKPAEVAALAPYSLREIVAMLRDGSASLEAAREALRGRPCLDADWQPGDVQDALTGAPVLAGEDRR